MMHSRTTQQGFTLVETLVAITILLIVIVGPMSISSATARSTSFASEQVTAFFLAQEGVELVIKTRDEAWLSQNFNPAAWGSVMDESTGSLQRCFLSRGCGLEITTDLTATLRPPIDCANGACRLYYNDLTDRSRFTHISTAAVSTLYTREVRLSTINAQEVRVQSVVTWRTGNQRAPQQVIVETYLFDVYGN